MSIGQIDVFWGVTPCNVEVIYLRLKKTSASLSRVLAYSIMVIVIGGTAVAQWLRYCATNRKVAGSIPAGVIVIFH